MRRILVGLLATVLVAITSVTLISNLAAQPPGGPPSGGPGGPPGGRPQGGPAPGMMGMPIDTFATERDSLVKVILDDLGPKASMPAESVFKNLKMIKGRTAEQLLQTMNRGFGRSLGVRCQHCHVLGHWRDDDKNTKQIARDMMTMTGKINDELLPAIKNIKSEHPGVGCFTCHRGTARPGNGPMAQQQQQQQQPQQPAPPATKK